MCRGKFGTLLAVSSAHDFSHNLEKHAKEIQYCLSPEFQSLGADFFRQARALIRKQIPKLKKRIPRPHQKTAIKNAVEHFVINKNKRGKLIHPCGTGKSLIGYWIGTALEAKSIVVALPSLYLVRQTLADWAQESLALQIPMDWMVVCSESTIGESNDPTMRFQELGVDVTTGVDQIAAFLRKRGKARKVIFTTYQSGDVTARAARKANKIFDVGIFDEAHRTVGQIDSMFSHLIDEKNIRIRKRIFMTATERRYQGASDTILSMDDVGAYGETFDKITFKEALEQKNPILSDYKIVTMVIGKSEVQHLLDENFLVKPDKGKWDDDTEARTLAALIALRKVMKKYRAKHALTFHNSIAKAEAFKESQEKFSDVAKGYGKVDCFHVSSKVSTGERKAELERFKRSKNALITNAKCLTEGVDVPTIDAVLFADTKRSTVDIVQAAGRALRPSEGKKMGYIVVPVLVDENDPDAADKAFQDILMTLRAMASNDDRIIDYFRSISQGKRPSKSGSVVDFVVPDSIKINLDDFLKDIETQVWHRLAKISWRPFEQAREFAQSLKLSGNTEWRKYTRTDAFPPDLPANPDTIYKEKGWVSWGEWLGTGNIAPFLKEYRDFMEARAFAHSLALKSLAGWIAFTKSGELPDDIPAYPSRTYSDKGWKGVGDWLGTGTVATHLRDYRPFKEARAFAQDLNLEGNSDWRAYSKTDKLPSDIPSSPDRTYKGKGWVNWGDWLGTGTIAPHLMKYRPFVEAKAFAQKQKLKSGNDWIEFAKTEKLPNDIPASPRKTYKNKGWKGMGDWLGTRTIAPNLKKYRPFEHARAFAQSLKLKNRQEWIDFTKTNKLPPDISASPGKTYKDKGWKGMGDWLGTGNIANYLKKYQPFEKARAVARSLELKSGTEWRAYIKEYGLPSDVPSNPNTSYKDKGWAGMGDWLGTDNISNALREYRSFEKARIFARSLELKSGSEWSEFAKTDKIPPDIPAAPNQVYKDKGWKGFGDWLGTGNIAPGLRQFRSFMQARAFARNLKLKSQTEWKEFTKTGDLPQDIPSNPNRTYKDNGWMGMGDWLGTRAIAPQAREYSSFEDARTFARGLKLKTWADWTAFAKTVELPPDIPATPAQIYKDKGWVNMSDWLGTK